MQDCFTPGGVTSARCYLTGQKNDSVNSLQSSEVVKGAKSWDMDDHRLDRIQTLLPQQWLLFTPENLESIRTRVMGSCQWLAVSDYHVDECRLFYNVLFKRGCCVHRTDSWSWARNLVPHHLVSFLSSGFLWSSWFLANTMLKLCHCLFVFCVSNDIGKNISVYL